ncbi:hypothetical protein BDV30DRAFT_234712 [Aspergillus minisclerotigenes]|uniref:Uncharacterized protein n=1 Tax=Aspergillus minisclerotigenes TaxID=656917 RepID=A0A5N6JGE8_9EURO|nr:hypothetical protein BDV30DRAFT_234712 [Aspergillus minisclerotigenes]
MIPKVALNLHVDGKWYRPFHRLLRPITSPDTPATLAAIRNIISATTMNYWNRTPFPTPLHIQLRYVYTIDKDLGILTITQWSGPDGVPSRLVRQAKLAEIQDPSLTTVEAVLQNVEDFFEQHSTQYDQKQSFAALNIDIGTPTSLNELQFRLFTNFVFLWKFYFDDVASWSRGPLLNTLAIGILRIAAWDFEMLLDTDTHVVPIGPYSVPRWSPPSGDIFWFHGLLVTLYSPTDLVETVIQKAREFLDRNQCLGKPVHVILISLIHVTLVEISGTCVQRSLAIPLIVNSSAIHPSPGFRVLASVLSSNSWKIPRAHTETWQVNLPFEVFDRILEGLPPKDIISFAQASFAGEKWYYTSLPQLNGLYLRSFDFSIPCCGRQFRADTDGVHCSLCYAWSHKKCVDRASERLDNEYICSKCRQNKTCTTLDTGGIYGEYRGNKSRMGCKVAINGSLKTLNLWAVKPENIWRELFLIRDLPIPPRPISYTVCFNGVFSGLAYDLDE